MSKNILNFQDIFLNILRKENKEVNLYMVNKTQLKGYIKAFDNFIILLENENGQQMIYKHSISSIVPVVKTDLLKELPGQGEKI